MILDVPDELLQILPVGKTESFNNLSARNNADFAHLKEQRLDTIPDQTHSREIEEFVVEAIVKRKRAGKEFRWLVKWEGYEEASWEPESCFIDDDGGMNDIWQKFEEFHPRKQMAKSPPKKKRKINK